MKWWLLFLALFIGCGNQQQSVFILPQHLEKVSIVAVLPFSNFSNDQHAGDVVSELFSAKLFKTGKFKVMDKSEMQRLIQDKNFILPEEIDRSTAARLASVLGVDGVFYGAVLEYSYLDEIRDGQVMAREPVVGLQARMVEGKSGSLIWATAHSRSSYEMVRSNRDSITKVANSAIDEMLKTLVIKK
jgi:TolB-like protein